MKYTEINGKKVSQLSLGTAQLGMNYGIANFAGKPSLEKSYQILNAALGCGITSLDTAMDYGDAEDVIGGYFRKYGGDAYITTKFKSALAAGAPAYELEKELEAGVKKSLSRLGKGMLDCLLLHNAGDMKKYGKALTGALSKMVSEGSVGNVGVSVYRAKEIDEMLKHDIFTAIQLPMNVFDRRLIESGHIKKLVRGNVKIFVRSVFFQGLFFLKPQNLRECGLSELEPYIKNLQKLAEEENTSLAGLALSYIKGIEGVAGIVLGVDSPEQIKENIAFYDSPPLTERARLKIEREFSGIDPEKIISVLSRPKV